MTYLEKLLSFKHSMAVPETVDGTIGLFDASLSTYSFVVQLVVALDNGCLWPLTVEVRPDHAGALLTILMTAAGVLPSDEPRSPCDYMRNRRVRMIFGREIGETRNNDRFTCMCPMDGSVAVSMNRLEEQAADLARKRLEKPWVLRPLPKASEEKEEELTEITKSREAAQ